MQLGKFDKDISGFPETASVQQIYLLDLRRFIYAFKI
jgi:hypothetical protein